MSHENLPTGSKAGFVVYVALALLGISIFWISARPPMVDIPQHAAQILAVRDILQGHFNWLELVRLDLKTPYLAGYIPTLLLSTVLPLPVAMALMLSVALPLFLFATVLLRREMKGVPELDYLAIAGYFGFAYYWGFYTFLIALPFGLFYLVFALRYARQPTLRRGCILLVCGVAMFAAHAIVFSFCSLFGGLFLLRHNPQFKKLFVAGLPYMAIAFVLSCYILASRNPLDPDTILFLWMWDPVRLLDLLTSTMHGDVKRFSFFVSLQFGLVLTLVGSAFIVGRVARPLQPDRVIFFFGLLFFWMLMPTRIFDTAYIYQRFAILAFPFFALLFDVRPALATQRWRQGVARVVIPLACAGLLLTHIHVGRAFDAEGRDFAQVIAKLEPRQTALYLPFDPTSPATENKYLYLHYGMWYQVEQQGWVDFNFASFLPQLVKYRDDHRSAIGPGFSFWPERFNWKTHNGRMYRYFIIRAQDGQPDSYFENLLANDECAIAQVVSLGKWRVYERKTCRE